MLWKFKFEISNDEKLKEMLERIATGIKNKLGLYGSFAGNYQVAVITLKYE
jgi:hypothetical protein